MSNKYSNIEMGLKLLKMVSILQEAGLLHGKQDATTPVATELLTQEMTLGQTISRNPLRRLVGVMSKGRL